MTELTPQEKLLKLQEMGKMPTEDFVNKDNRTPEQKEFDHQDGQMVEDTTGQYFTNQKLDQILIGIQEIKTLLQTSPKPKNRFPQTCSYCGATWNARIEHPVQCPSCHNDLRKKPRHITAAVDPDREQKEFEETCKKFDSLIKEKGKVVRELNSSPKRRWVFSKALYENVGFHGGIIYQKFEIPDFCDVNTPPLEEHIIHSSCEILKDFEWRSFLFDKVYGEKLW